MRYKSSALRLHFGKLHAPASVQDGRCVMEQQHPLLSQHPTASLRLQPPPSLQFYLPHLPNTAKLILPFACPSACPPSPMIQKVSFEIQGSGGRNVAGSGVREAERGGISPLQPFASMNQQPQSSCQAQGCWARPGARGCSPPAAPDRATQQPLLSCRLLSFSGVIPSSSRCQQNHP